MTRHPRFAALLPMLSLFSLHALAQASRVQVDHHGSTIVLEAYAPNIIRVTLSLHKEEALVGPGYGVTASPDGKDWTQTHSDQGDTYRSSQLTVTVRADKAHQHLPTEKDIAKYFNGSTPGAHISVADAQGKTLLDMTGWSMSVPNHKDGNAAVLNDRRPSDLPFYQVGATFASPNDEHYYGLGQNQEGYLDHRRHTVECWHNYTATGGPAVCVPFLVTNRGYGLIWDNPSRTWIEPGFNEATTWTSEVGNRVSFFVIAGQNFDEIYSGFRHLTGSTPMLPKAAYGYIQCKQRYSTQDEVLAVAKGYRERHLPADVIVVDWFYWTKMGNIDMDPEKWPDPAAMNRQLHDMGFQTMISVWPRFVPEARYYDLLLKNGWLEHLADGTPIDGLPYDRAGSDIDTTNPDAAHWYWDTIHNSLESKGFDSFWMDETEPDLPPNGSYWKIGPGTRFFNVFPLFHTAAIYNGFRRDVKHRALILSRDAYLGAQHNAAMFWSSDIHPTWDTLNRQIPTGLNFTASGMPYWSTDIGGWQYLPPEHHPEHTPLLDGSDAKDNIGGYEDYAELYTRWFEYAAFQPIFRAHGSRRYNEVWSYGKTAEPILEKFLKLRYQLMPYIYSLAYHTNQTGAPYMRGLFMDFPQDPKVADIPDEYMFGPDFLVAPVTTQGATGRTVYLPAGNDWYNYWTNARITGGQTVQVEAPIETLPLFVRAGSILPLGEPVESTSQTQNLSRVRVYAGADADFTLYDDDGKTYDYEQGTFKMAHFHWNDTTGRLSHDGIGNWTLPDTELLELIGR